MKVNRVCFSFLIKVDLYVTFLILLCLVSCLQIMNYQTWGLEKQLAINYRIIKYYIGSIFWRNVTNVSSLPPLLWTETAQFIPLFLLSNVLHADFMHSAWRVLLLLVNNSIKNNELYWSLIWETSPGGV